MSCLIVFFILLAQRIGPPYVINCRVVRCTVGSRQVESRCNDVWGGGISKIRKTD
jgi:hypothetical protein